MENTQIFEMADRLKTLQEQKKDLEAQTKALGAEIAELDEQLSDAMTEAELDRFSRNGSTFYLKSRLFASPASGRKDEMMQALKENGYANLCVKPRARCTLEERRRSDSPSGRKEDTWIRKSSPSEYRHPCWTIRFTLSSTPPARTPRKRHTRR